MCHLRRPTDQLGRNRRRRLHDDRLLLIPTEEAGKKAEQGERDQQGNAEDQNLEKQQRPDDEEYGEQEQAEQRQEDARHAYLDGESHQPEQQVERQHDDGSCEAYKKSVAYCRDTYRSRTRRIRV